MSTDGLPLAEAAFPNRSSFVSAGALRTDFDEGGWDPNVSANTSASCPSFLAFLTDGA